MACPHCLLPLGSVNSALLNGLGEEHLQGARLESSCAHPVLWTPEPGAPTLLAPKAWAMDGMNSLLSACGAESVLVTLPRPKSGLP